MVLQHNYVPFIYALPLGQLLSVHDEIQIDLLRCADSLYDDLGEVFVGYKKNN